MSEKNGLILVPSSFIVEYLTEKIQQSTIMLEKLYNKYDELNDSIKLNILYDVIQRNKLLLEFLKSIKT